MKLKNLSIVIPAILLIISCSAPDAEKQISKLESEKASLQTKIKEIDKKIAELREGNTDSLIVKPVAVALEQIHPESFKDYIKVQGDVTSDMNIQVPAEYSGVIRNVNVEEGDNVRKGTLLAKIDSDILIKQKEELEKSLELATTTYERQKRLWDQKIGSEIQYLQAKNQKESLEKKMETLDQQLTKTNITAPISGNIDKVYVKEGEIIQMGLPSFRIVQLSNLKIEAEVSEKFVADVSKGDSVEVSFPATGSSFVSTIHAISQVIDPENRTFTVEIDIPSSKDNIKPNMIGEIKIYNYVNNNALTIPMNIIQKNENTSFVFVAEEKDGELIAQRRNIKIKRYNTTRAEIEEGINPGDKVIVEGYQNVSDNQPLSLPE